MCLMLPPSSPVEAGGRSKHKVQGAHFRFFSRSRQTASTTLAGASSLHAAVHRSNVVVGLIDTVRRH